MNASLPCFSNAENLIVFQLLKVTFQLIAYLDKAIFESKATTFHFQKNANTNPTNTESTATPLAVNTSSKS
jgi:hypothetical protein